MKDKFVWIQEYLFGYKNYDDESLKRSIGFLEELNERIFLFKEEKDLHSTANELWAIGK